MTLEVVTLTPTEIVTIENDVIQVVTIAGAVEVVTVGGQGPAGPRGETGAQGPIGDASGALLVTNRLSEFSTAQMKIDARTNLELNHIDCGEFL